MSKFMQWTSKAMWRTTSTSNPLGTWPLDFLSVAFESTPTRGEPRRAFAEMDACVHFSRSLRTCLLVVGLQPKQDPTPDCSSLLAQRWLTLGFQDTASSERQPQDASGTGNPAPKRTRRFPLRFAPQGSPGSHKVSQGSERCPITIRFPKAPSISLGNTKVP